MPTLLTSEYYGPFHSNKKSEKTVETLTSLIQVARDAFEENVDAVAVVDDGKVIGIWVNEPDIDSDHDGYYEVQPSYEGQQYNLYRPNHRSFWGLFAYYFGLKYIPSDAGFTSKATATA